MLKGQKTEASYLLRENTPSPEFLQFYPFVEYTSIYYKTCLLINSALLLVIVMWYE